MPIVARRSQESSGTRGVTYWASGEDQRIYVGIDEYLYALNAKDGEACHIFWQQWPN
jgi:hypothetical protein